MDGRGSRKREREPTVLKRVARGDGRREKKSFANLVSRLLGCLGLLDLVVTQHSGLLGVDSLNLSVTGSLVLVSLGLHLFAESLLTSSFGLGAVDVLDESTLVLEGITPSRLLAFRFL